MIENKHALLSYFTSSTTKGQPPSTGQGAAKALHSRRTKEVDLMLASNSPAKRILHTPRFSKLTTTPSGPAIPGLLRFLYESLTRMRRFVMSPKSCMDPMVLTKLTSESACVALVDETVPELFRRLTWIRRLVRRFAICY